MKSPSGKEDEVREFVLKYLRDLNPEVDEAGNVLVDNGGDVWVTSHMDTVAGEFYPFSFENGICFGTGVADDKASVAAMLVAARETEGLNFAFFVDEEENGMGSQHFAEKVRKGKAVVMEPTELRICNEHWGVFEALVSVHGKPAHASMPDYGVNAIEKALELIEKLRNFRCGKFSLLSIKSYPENLYSVPYRCEVKFEYLIPYHAAVPVLEVLETCERFGDVTILEMADPFVSEEIDGLLKMAAELSGIEPELSFMPSWTDAVNLREAGWDVVVFGPGELHKAHTPFECVSIEEVVKAVEVLKNLSRVVSSGKN